MAGVRTIDGAWKAYQSEVEAAIKTMNRAIDDADRRREAALDRLISGVPTPRRRKKA